MENETLPDHVHCINMYRFLNRSDLAERRGKLRFAANCIASLAEAVDTSLAEAGTHHFALEEIYRSAMDFAGVHQISEELCTTLFPTR
jgi:hypothetical protein